MGSTAFWLAGVASLGFRAGKVSTLPAPPGPSVEAQAAAGLPSRLPGAALIDALVARVNRHSITQSELEGEARIALAVHGDVAAAEGPLRPSDLSAALDYLVDQLLLADEAERLQLPDVTEEEELAASRALQAHFPTPLALEAFCARFGLAREAVVAALRRGLRAGHYLDDRLRLQVSGGAEAQAAARTLVAQVRSRAEVRILGPLEPLAPPTSRPESGSAPHDRQSSLHAGTRPPANAP